MTLYDILQCHPKATHTEIKENYHRLAKELHPDKGGCHNKFTQITDAWNILGNPQSRREYDERLLEERVPISAELNLSEMQQNQNELFYYEICRCGGVFRISMDIVSSTNQADIVVPCDDCSFHIRVKLPVK